MMKYLVDCWGDVSGTKKKKDPLFGLRSSYYYSVPSDA